MRRCLITIKKPTLFVLKQKQLPLTSGSIFFGKNITAGKFSSFSGDMIEFSAIKQIKSRMKSAQSQRKQPSRVFKMKCHARCDTLYIIHGFILKVCTQCVQVTYIMPRVHSSSRPIAINYYSYISRLLTQQIKLSADINYPFSLI